MLDTDTMAQRVRNVLPGTLRQGEASIKVVAKRLNTSSRTLQRKLQEEGVSYTDMIDQVRQELARRYIHENQMSLGEIAFVLGFSQPSAFYRAFKRWMGLTPTEFRESTAKSA
jgi:AraC-like DNA-binding protein